MKTNQKIAVIVSEMLTPATQKATLKIKDIKDLNAEVLKADKQKYIVSLDLAHALNKVKPAFDEFCTAVKNRLKDEGFTAKELPNQADLIFAVYGLSKSWFHRLIKVGGIDPKIRNKFNDLCDEAEKNGDAFTRSIDALNTWASKYDDHKGEADTDSDTLAEMRSGGEKRVILWQIKEGNKTLTMYDDHSKKTNFTLLEINAFFNEVLTPAIKSTFAIKKATTSKDKQVLTAIQKERVKKLVTSKDLN
jgi:hypothetical protein